MKPDLIFYRSMNVEQSVLRTTQALRSIGRVTKSDFERGEVKGNVSTAMRGVEMDIKIKESAEGESEITVTAFAFEIGMFATDSAIKRFAEAFDNVDNPNFIPDKTGVPPYVIVLFIVFAIVMQILNLIFHLI